MEYFISRIPYAFSGINLAIGGVTLNEAVAVFGVILGIATFVVNWVYKHRDYALKQQDFLLKQQQTNTETKGEPHHDSA